MAKTYTSVVTKSTGNTLSATDWNTYVRDNINNLIVPPTCGVRKAGAQSVSTGTWTAISWDTELWDTDTMFDSGTNPSRLTAKTAGLYLISANIAFTNRAGGVATLGAISKAGDMQAVHYQYNLGIGYLGILHVSGIFDMAVNDYAEIYVYQDSGGSLNTMADADEIPMRAQMHWLGKKS